MGLAKHMYMRAFYRCCLALLLALPLSAWATGEPSTYFNIFVPPNNDAVRRDAALIVTAIYDSTWVTIQDDGMDGDTDDNWSGYLMAGQSYILYIRDNGINDDARYASGGVLKQDGDYFIIQSNQVVYASQSTNSDWQHDWVPSINKTSKGEKFIVYSPPFSNSKRDVNVMPYEDSTYVTIKRISLLPTTVTGKTNVSWDSARVVAQRLLRIGQDLIYAFPEGRDLMDAGHTYVIETSKAVTVQYGALFGNERDGGGYVPSSNGSSAGELMYFTVPYQAAGEQEIRIVSWHDNNAVSLSRYSNGSWVTVQNWNLNNRKAADWVGRSNGNVAYPTVFRLTCSAGKKVSVFEGNWFETGSPGTSDMATMVSSENGTSAGTYFLSYMAPPGNEQNVRDPFTNTLFGKRLSHLYLFARDSATVTVRDANTGGTKINRTYQILPNRYVDCALDEAQWMSIYNGTGTPSGPDRPYLEVSSNRPVSVMNSNFNDNWMMYFGSSQEQSFKQTSSSSSSNLLPGDTVRVVSQIQCNRPLLNPDVEVLVGPGLQVVESVLQAGAVRIKGRCKPKGAGTAIDFIGEPNSLPSGNSGTVTTTVVAQVYDEAGRPLTGTVVSNVETLVSGISGGDFQQSVSTEGLVMNTQNQNALQFSLCQTKGLADQPGSSWTGTWIDMDNDGWEDLFCTETDRTKPNALYKNNGNGNFSRVTQGPLVTDKGVSISNAWADVDNDGDADALVINNTFSPSFLYTNQGAGSFSRNEGPGFTKEVSYFHSGVFADYDRDGKLDLFLSNYWPTRFNELYKNEGNGSFSKNNATILSVSSNASTGATWADYDNDGYPDLFIPNHDGNKNALYRNLGNGQFEKKENLAPALDGGYAVGSCWGDVDNDGDLDLFVANASKQKNSFFRNLGNGTFEKVTTGIFVNEPGHHHGCSFADWDKDGDLDLYVTGDQGFKCMYRNDGSGNFEKVNNEYPISHFGKAFGHAWADYDKDGDLDLFVATHSNQLNYLFCNNGNSNRWLNIRLVGTRSNASAIGARIRCKAAGKWQMREISSQSGIGGNSSLRAYFGFGSTLTVDSIQVWWPSGMVQQIGSSQTNQFLTLTEPLGALVSGKVYEDRNNNCAHDAGEPLLCRHRISLGQGQTVVSDEDGRFQVSLSPGNYRIRPTAPVAGTYTCQTERNLNLGNTSVSDQDFAFQAACPNADLALHFGSVAWRKGFAKTSDLQIENKGRATARQIQIRLVHKPGFYVIKSGNLPQTNTAPFEWTLDSLPAGGLVHLNLVDSISRISTVGMQDSLVWQLSYAGTDCNPADNRIRFEDEIVGAIDPNDIAVWPKGYGSGGLIPAGTWLQYRIRFINKGTWMASRVEITDPLPEGLDLSTLEVENMSHEARVNLRGQTLQFFFENINLPDSLSEPEKSQGFVFFRIRTLKNLMPGTRLPNQAHIVFDYEDPVYTNIVLNTIEQAGKGKDRLLVWPNPSTGELKWRVESLDPVRRPMQPERLRVWSATGKKLAEISLQSEESTGAESLESLPAGLYLLEFSTASGEILQTRWEKL